MARRYSRSSRSRSRKSYAPRRSYRAAGRSSRSRGKRGSVRRTGGGRTQTVRLVIRQEAPQPASLAGLVQRPAPKRARF